MTVEVMVVGTTSLDTLHLGETITHTYGGAGLYTALAVHQAGGVAGLYGPRPHPMPSQLQPLADRVTWVGPTINEDELPRLEIAHYGNGRAKLLNASWGAEPDFLPMELPTEVINSPLIHIAAMSSATRQLDFLLAFHQHEAMAETVISVGTYGRLVYEENDRVGQLFSLADIFFMNENEAIGFFGHVDKATTAEEALLFVTLGAGGVWVIEGTERTHVAALPTTEVDPTGAGDTFCGATLAGLMQGLSPVEAAEEAVRLAAQVVSAVGARW